MKDITDMNNLYVALDEDSDGEMWILGIFPSLDMLKKSVSYTAYKTINIDYLDSGFYVNENGELNKIE